MKLVNRFKGLLNAFKHDYYAWTPISTPIDKPDALVVFYAPHAVYIWGCGKDYLTVKEEYPDVSHYRIISEAP